MKPNRPPISGLWGRQEGVAYTLRALFLFVCLISTAAQAQFSIRASVSNTLDQRRAAAFATVSGGQLTSVTVRNGGATYTAPPVVTVGPPASGTTAQAVAVISGGVVTAINITAPGSGYTIAPFIHIAPPKVPTGPALSSLHQAGRAITSAASSAIAAPANYPQAIATVSGNPVIVVVLKRSTFGYSFASGAPRYLMGEVIERPLLGWDNSPKPASYWRTEPVKPGETFNGSTVPVPQGSVSVTSSSASSNEVTVASVPFNLTSGASLLGQRVNIVRGTTLVLAGNANQTISTATSVGFSPVPAFYYSPHADKVFATQSGRVSITWVSATPDTTALGETVATFKFRTETFAVSSGTVSPARNYFWTERSAGGPLTTIPAGQIKAINAIYNTRFTSHVAAEFRPAGSVPNPLIPDEFRTFWSDSFNGDIALHAYNLEGRVFVEYLGTERNDGSGRQLFLGADILDIRRTAEATIIDTLLGEALRPRQDALQNGDDDLVPNPVSNFNLTGKALYGRSYRANGDVVFHAERENTRPDDVQFYWQEQLDAGIHFYTPPSSPDLGIRWPKFLRKYTFSWPASISAYEPVVVTSNGNSAATGPKFDSAHVPSLSAQDDPNESEISIDIQSATLVADFSASADKTGRALLKFTSSTVPWYVRIFVQSQELLGSPGAGNVPAVQTLSDRNGDGVADIAATAPVGQRIIAPPGYATAGYIANGTAYYPAGYRDPFATGVEAAAGGAIIPVNARSTNNQLTIWWFKQVAAPGAGFASFYVPAIAATYTLQWPSNAPQLVIASGRGTGPLGPSQAVGSVYYENDATQPGFNPNEEHALMVAGSAYALRDDLNAAGLSQPFVLIAYTAPSDGRPSIDTYAVLRSTPAYPLTYNAIAGTKVQPPMPLGALPLPLDANDNVLNTEVPGTPDNAIGPGAPTSYQRFTFTDRQGYHWIYRGAHDNATPSYGMKFYYVSREGFFIPSLSLAAQPGAGTIMPFVADTGSGISVTLTYLPKWPDDTSIPVAQRTVLPVLQTGQTLTLAKSGLPAVRGQSSAQVIYQQSIANTGATKNSVLLHDPTREKTVDLSSVGLTKLPSSILTSDYAGRTYFQGLAPNLQNRFYFDANRGPNGTGALVLIGEFVDEIVGEDYLNLNALSTADIADLKALCPSGDSTNKAKWDRAIEGVSITTGVPPVTVKVSRLKTTLETFVEDPAVPGSYKVDPTKNRDIDESTLPDITDPDTAVDSYALTATGKGTGYVTLVFGNGQAFTDSGDPIVMQILKVDPALYPGEVKVLLSSNPLDEQVTLRQSNDYAAQPELYDFEWRYGFPLNGTNPPITGGNISTSASTTNWIKPNGTLENSILVGGDPSATISSPAVLMGDTYFTMAYRKKTPDESGTWSAWTQPKLVEGWIKRVLAKITPFNQRMTDLYSNDINDDVSVITQAGKRWEGDIALNLSNINDYGLIEIYETVLNRGKTFTVGSGYDFAPSNSALILAAGYLNDLYTILGNEAFADAANPTIAIDDEANITEVNTSRFAFESQVSSSLEEELALLRGRDDFVNPGVTFAPAYNRLWWNYTRGINSGEALYAVNYNIKENANSSSADGIVDAADAQRMYPQGHGDAYGHYLTALTGYYKLLTHPFFTWTASSEDITILGQSVQVDYKDERKFAQAASNLVATAKQVVALTHRQSYKDDPAAGWSHFRDGKVNANTGVVRQQGLDETVSRSAAGSYFNWVVGNALLPDKDTNPQHTGVQIIDRTTVPELDTLVTAADEIQSSIDSANAHLNPLGLSPSAIAFDISPADLRAGKTHFEQIYERALRSVLNAKGAFNQAAKMTRLLRNIENQVSDNHASINDALGESTSAMIELFGRPYAGDIGVGKTYAPGYDGPDLYRWFYIDKPSGLVDTDKTVTVTVPVPTQVTVYTGKGASEFSANGSTPVNTVNRTLTIKPNSTLQWADSSMGVRPKIGRLQNALLDAHSAQLTLLSTANQITILNERFKREFQLVNEAVNAHEAIIGKMNGNIAMVTSLESIRTTLGIVSRGLSRAGQASLDISSAIAETPPIVAGVDNDFTSLIRGSVLFQGAFSSLLFGIGADIADGTSDFLGVTETVGSLAFDRDIEAIGFSLEEKQQLFEFEQTYRELLSIHHDLAAQAVDLQRANEELRTALTDGASLLTERETFNKRAAAVVYGLRNRDLTFRVFRNEALTQYRTLFDLAGRYTYLAAKSYDYETGLLGSTEGQRAINAIVASRALGDLTNDLPQATVSTLGDAGLAGTMAQLTADFSVAKGRLGINNPDQYGTVFSLRSELFRIRTDAAITADDDAWKQTLEQHIVPDLLADPDVARLCNNLKKPNGTAVPGILIPFSTVIGHELNFFGHPIAAGDHFYTPASFATKINSVGIALRGYVGMDPYTVGQVGAGGPSSSSPNALAATPYLYLIPVGTDYMRAPALGDTNIIRSFTVHDQALPLPYNLGASAFNTTSFFSASGTLTEQPWIVRKHQPFRPVADPGFFYSSVPNEFTNSRLVARSAWNGQWKIVIPAYYLLNNESDALTRFVNSVQDIQLFLRTYSHSGN